MLILKYGKRIEPNACAMLRRFLALVICAVFFNLFWHFLLLRKDRQLIWNEDFFGLLGESWNPPSKRPFDGFFCARMMTGRFPADYEMRRRRETQRRAETSAANYLRQIDWECSDVNDTFKDAASSCVLSRAIHQIGCDAFLRRRGYVTQVSHAPSMSLAFSILVYRNARQAERLLRAIYRPNNFYCLHLDTKASTSTVSALETLASCFPGNVFLTNRREDVVYAGFSRLQADINCMAELLDKKRNGSADWRYLLNLSGQEFPLVTIERLVEILTLYNDTNDIRSYFPTTSQQNRFRFVWKVVTTSNGKTQMRKTSEPKTQPPAPLTFNDIYKASAYGVFTRVFIRYIVYDRFAKAFLEWTKDTYSPDEHFWQTLHRNYRKLKTPGGRPIKLKKVTPRIVMWLPLKQSSNSSLVCHGRDVRRVCVFGPHDLPWIRAKADDHLFVNKFDVDTEPLALECMEEWMGNKTRSAVGRGGAHEGGVVAKTKR